MRKERKGKGEGKDEKRGKNEEIRARRLNKVMNANEVVKKKRKKEKRTGKKKTGRKGSINEEDL